jgi:hypothetical protein
MYVEYGYNARDEEEREARKALAKANGFTPDDFAENVKGRISTRQLVQLLVRGVAPFLGTILQFVGLVVLGITLYFVLPMLGTRVRFLLIIGKYFVPAIGALAFGLLALLVKTVLTSKRFADLIFDMSQGKVAHTVGRVSVTRSEEVEDGIDQIFGRRTKTYFYVTKDHRFEVSEEAHSEMYHLGSGWYSIYYTPRSMFLLSIDPRTGTA